MVEITLHIEGGVLNNVKLIEDTQVHRIAPLLLENLDINQK